MNINLENIHCYREYATSFQFGRRGCSYVYVIYCRSRSDGRLIAKIGCTTWLFNRFYTLLGDLEVKAKLDLISASVFKTNKDPLYAEKCIMRKLREYRVPYEYLPVENRFNGFTELFFISKRMDKKINEIVNQADS